jgi:hypothetical protein
MADDEDFLEEIIKVRMAEDEKEYEDDWKATVDMVNKCIDPEGWAIRNSRKNKKKYQAKKI